MLVALMAEYRKSTIEYKTLLAGLPQALFEKITDEDTKDEDCKSIQTITRHVVNAGYTYSNYINTVCYNKDWFHYTEAIETPKKAIQEMNIMLDYAEQSLEGLLYKTNAEIEAWSFETRWHVTYDFEQLMEHAIVHVLRHRLQMETVIKQQLK